MSTGKNHVTATMTHADGAVMAYEILGTQHFATNQTPIVLIQGMACIKIDWERLANALSTIRPVLLLDHRGMGGSTFSPEGDEIMTIETYARDVLDLLIHLQWKKIALCGFSMGGLISQQILLLPYHATNPTPLPFTITHVFLTGTSTTPMRQKDIFLIYVSVPPPEEMAKEERRKLARPCVEVNFDKDWLADRKHLERADVLIENAIAGRRPAEAIFQEARACSTLNFKVSHSNISPNIPILIIHGENDQVVPFSSTKETLSVIPHARFVSVGPNKGQLPNLKFGHLWYEYFDIQVWVDVFESFMQTESNAGTKL